MPLGGAVSASLSAAWLWQVENNGPWRWEVGEHVDDVFVALSGPTDVDHQWQQPLAPGSAFTTVPVTVALGRDLDAAVAALTHHRRASRRPHPDNARPAIVFNDYMNTLDGDPTTEKLLPLVDAAAAVGAEVFCIDAGWYDDGGDWWPSVGAWQPSTVRFSGGLAEVTDRIRSHGMVPGLWLEPESVGVLSPIAASLPPEAFLQRSGQRIQEQERLHLDLRHPAARAHLDEVVDRLVLDFGVGYFKLDYNTDPGAGTDVQRPQRRRRPPRAHPRGPRLARRGPRPPPRPRVGGLLLRRHARGPGHPRPGPGAIHLRPAGLPALPAHRRRGTAVDAPRAGR